MTQTLHARMPARPSTAPHSVVVLVPAHNEAAQIGATIESLLAQSVPPERIVVAADNCTDNTVAIASQYPVTVMETADNAARKSGALNQAWLRYAQDAEFVLTMDADTTLRADTIQGLLESILAERTRAAVCARYWAKDGTGMAWRLQRLEYARYDDTRELRNWRVQVASGAASLYRGRVLRRVVDAYQRPGPWDDHSLIEDYALTLDIKTLGYQVRAAAGAQVLTDTPADFRSLWQQRLRWGRGGVDECRKRGWTTATRRDISCYGLFLFGMVLRLLWIAYVVALITVAAGFAFSLLGLIPLAFVWLDRVTSAWRLPQRGWIDVLISATVLAEDAYGLFLETCTAVSIVKRPRSTQQAW